MPLLARTYNLNFTGGEPLLSFGLLRRITALAEAENGKRGLSARYSLTTNGSLLSPAVLRFLASRRFTVTVSYDGPLQDAQRREGSAAFVRSRIESLVREPRLRLKVNSVFTPRTVGQMSETVRDLLDLDVPEFRLSFSVTEPWSASSLRVLRRELGACRTLALGRFRRTGRLPLADFREETRPGRIFRCTAGRDRLSVDPDGRVWGCHLFGDYFRRRGREAREGQEWSATLDGRKSGERRGRMRGRRESAEEVLSRLTARYEGLSMDRFATPERDCFLCPDVTRCAVCPVSAALSGAPLGRIPEHVCRIRKIVLEARILFRRSARRAGVFRRTGPRGSHGAPRRRIPLNGTSRRNPKKVRPRPL